jgi:putative N-acetylmannosamine-6-phosphate epimerase
MFQNTVQASLQAVEQMMQQELAIISAMSGAGTGGGAPALQTSTPGTGTVVDVTA